MNEVSLSLRGRQWAIVVADDRNWAFQEKLEFWETCVCRPELDGL